MQTLNFTAIDFETANHSRHSVCAVGIAVVRGGRVVRVTESLVRPPGGLHFHPRNIEIHGITPDQVADAPTWSETWEQIVADVGKDEFVAHNASFDRSVWRHASQMCGVAGAEPKFHCSMILSRRLLNPQSARLPAVAALLGIPSFVHHEAGADALACAEITVELARRFDLATTSEVEAVCAKRPGRRASR